MTHIHEWYTQMTWCWMMKNIEKTIIYLDRRRVKDDQERVVHKLLKRTNPLPRSKKWHCAMSQHWKHVSNSQFAADGTSWVLYLSSSIPLLPTSSTRKSPSSMGGLLEKMWRFWILASECTSRRYRWCICTLGFSF